MSGGGLVVFAALTFTGGPIEEAVEAAYRRVLSHARTPYPQDPHRQQDHRPDKFERAVDRDPLKGDAGQHE